MRAKDGSGQGRAGNGHRWVAAWLACAGVGAGSGAGAQPAPVLEGIWDVRSLVTHETLAAAGTVIATPPARARSYRICIGPERARNPMLPRALPPSAEIIFDGPAYTGSFEERAGRKQVEMGYRRLSATAFEGWHEVADSELITRTQFDAQYGGPICGAAQPGWPADSGEP